MTKPPASADIISARKAAKLTQSAAAAIVHVGREQWAAWESERYRMPAASWELFCIKAKRLKSKKPAISGSVELVRSV